MKFLEDHVVGEKIRHGFYSVTRESVLDFAATYARAINAAGDAERIRTSGCHTVAIFQKMQIEMGFAVGSAPAMLAALAIDELRWLAPVYSGDVLEAECEVLEITPSRSKPDRGVIRARYVLYNQAGEAVLSLISTIMMKRQQHGD